MTPRPVVLAAVLALLAAPPPLRADEKARRIDALVEAYRQIGQFNGSVLVAEKGAVLFKKGYGLAQMEWGTPNAPDTRFRLGSITKQFTATLVLRQGEPEAGRKEIGHGGGINGFNTLIRRVPDDRSLIVLLNNTGATALGAIALGIREVLAGREPAPPKQGIADAIAPVLLEQGAVAALERYRTLKTTRAADFGFEEFRLNTMGYQLLGRDRADDAIAIFKLNVEAFPRSGNVHDSLGEAYLKAGQKELAIASYRKSLERTPDNQNARDVLKKLEAPAP